MHKKNDEESAGYSCPFFPIKRKEGEWKLIPLFVALNLILPSMFFSSYAFALPQGGQVTAGSAQITSPSANTIQVNQTSNKAVIDWRSYNINRNELVKYQQPNSSSISLNRINPNQGPSQIFGAIKANGRVWLVNSAGIWFGSTARVDVAGLLATTASISTKDFMDGNYRFHQSPEWNGTIENDGVIIVRENGLAALVAPGVVNNGLIEANMGTVVLGASKKFTVDFTGDQLINFEVGGEVSTYATDHNGKTLSNAVTNTGALIANGGKILIAAQAAGHVLDKTINMSGLVEAKSVGVNSGEIILGDGTGTIDVSGQVIASGDDKGLIGGTIEVLAKKIMIENNAVLSVAGDQGGGSIYIGGNYRGSGPLPNADNIYFDKGAMINANALSNGNGGTVILWSENTTQAYGQISVQGGSLSGNGGFIETSGHDYLDVNGISVSALAPHGQIGTWLLDPTNIWIAPTLALAQAAGDMTSDQSASTPTGTDPKTFASTNAVTDSYLSISALQTALNSTNVVISTTSSGTGSGNITVTGGNFSWLANTSLTLNAAKNIQFGTGSTLISMGTASTQLVSFIAGYNIVINSDMNVRNGLVNLTAGNQLMMTNLGTIEARAATLNATNDMTIGGISTSGTVTATSSAGQITVDRNINAGSGDITLTTSPSGGAIKLTGGTITTTGTVNLTTPTSVTQTNNAIQSAQALIVSARTGINLTNPNNAVASFNAINSSSGEIDFANNSGTSNLTLNGVTQRAGAAINITNIGNIIVADNIAAGIFPATIHLTSSGTITQTGGSIGNNLTAISHGGMTLTGSNVMFDISAINTGSGDIVIYTIFGRNTSLHTISNPVGNVFINQIGVGGLTGVDSQLVASGSVLLQVTNANQILTLSNYNVTGNSVTYRADHMLFDAASLTNSENGLLTLAPYTAGQLIDMGANVATNTAGILGLATLGAANFTGTGGMIIGGTQAGDITVSDANIINGISGAITLSSHDNIRFQSAGSLTAVGNTVNLTSAGGMLIQDPGSFIIADLLTARAAGGISLIGANNSLARFNANNSVGGNITLLVASPNLTITGVDGAGANTNISITNTNGSIIVDGNIGNATSGAVNLHSSNNLILQSGVISSAGLITLVNGQTRGNVFTNSAGSHAINGHFNIWSYSPASDFLNGLDTPSIQYNATYGTTNSASTGENALFYNTASTALPNATIAQVIQSSVTPNDSNDQVVAQNSTTVNENIDFIKANIIKEYDNYLAHVKINPFCGL